MVDSKEMRKQISEKRRVIEQHRQEVCEYVQTPMRQKNEDVCKRIDSLCLQYHMLGRLEEKAEIKEQLERKTEKAESIH